MKYPAIVKSVSGNIFLCANEIDHYDFYLDEWRKWSDTIGLKNITAEYLANTYGEVKSKGHAEFIVKLAEVNKVVVCDVYRDSHKFFAVIDSSLLFFNSGAIAMKDGRKQITIPLPPEFESVDEWPKVGEVVLTASKSKAKVLATYNKKAWVEYVSGSEGFNTLSIASLQKPKTPEQELRDFISLLWDENNHDFDMFLDIVTEHVIKKPQ